jgi:hypothetical protein
MEELHGLLRFDAEMSSKIPPILGEGVVETPPEIS